MVIARRASNAPGERKAEGQKEERRKKKKERRKKKA
jgi:hypothetical protein